jgi:hypothetical protein
MKSQIQVITLVTTLCAGFCMQAADRQPTPKENVTIPAHELAVTALRSERVKLEVGKSTLFNVCQVAKQLRTVELQTSTNTAQRVAAHKRHVAVIRDLKDQTDKRIEKGLVASVEGKLLAQELKQAEGELLRTQNNK